MQYELLILHIIEFLFVDGVQLDLGHRLIAELGFSLQLPTSSLCGTDALNYSG